MKSQSVSLNMTAPEQTQEYTMYIYPVFGSIGFLIAGFTGLAVAVLIAGLIQFLW